MSGTTQNKKVKRYIEQMQTKMEVDCPETLAVYNYKMGKQASSILQSVRCN